MLRLLRTADTPDIGSRIISTDTGPGAKATAVLHVMVNSVSDGHLCMAGDAHQAADQTVDAVLILTGCCTRQCRAVCTAKNGCLCLSYISEKTII